MATMVVTCESCGTKFRLDSDKLIKPQNKVRCSKCKNVFLVEQPGEDGLIHIEISDEETTTFIPGAITQPIDKIAAPEEKKKGFSKKRILLYAAAAVFVLILIGAFFALGTGSSLFKIAGKTPPKEPAQPIVTIMDSVQAYYLENVHSGQVLVIEGEVLNESSKPVSFVMIEGKLFNNNDTAVQIQRCYAGNSLTRKEIANLKVSEIQEKIMYREGKNLKNVRIPPAGKVPFMLVFHNLPEVSTLSNYSVNVISSKFD